MRQIISMRISMIIPPAFPASGACTSICAFSWAPTDGGARLRVRRAHFGRRIARAWSRACSAFAARWKRLLADMLVGVLNVCIGARLGARSPFPAPFSVRVRRARAAHALTAVCACFCRRMAALVRWLHHQRPGHRCRAQIHPDRRQHRRPLHGPRASRWRSARHGCAPAVHEAPRAYSRSPGSPPWQHARACACCAR